MVIDTSVRFAEIDRSLDVIGRHTRAADNVYFDAQALSEALFGDHMPTNTLLLGAAWQRGLIPLSLAALEQAIRLNGAAVEKTLAAFHWGRAAVAAPDAVAAATRVELPQVKVDPQARAIVTGCRRAGGLGARAGARGPRRRADRLPGRRATPAATRTSSQSVLRARRAARRSPRRSPSACTS